jgi:transcriptional regulator with XRE-family HTH domain
LAACSIPGLKEFTMMTKMDAATRRITTRHRGNDLDAYVGRKIRTRRIQLGMSQDDLAKAIGVTYPQVYKYEKAINRVSAGRLFEIARVLTVPLSYFYDSPTNPMPKRDGAILELTDNVRRLQPADIVKVKNAVMDRDTAFRLVDMQLG